MTKSANISAYTPSNTDPEILERTFVQRDRLTEKLVNRFIRSMQGEQKHHALLIGTRGSGKTHMVTLIHHRLMQAQLDHCMRVAWLGEDKVITGLIDMALDIADALAAEYPKEFKDDIRAQVTGLDADTAADAALHLILEKIGDNKLLLIMENMNRSFSNLGDLGQKKWRAFLQETMRISILGTSQQLFKDISSRDKPFFGFFDIHHLKVLSYQDALNLISKIATEQENQEVLDFVQTPRGQVRVRAIHYLAGGNHRMYVLLSEFLTKASLDDLVIAFENLADELTPYFQERVNSLPPQQGKIVQELCNAPGAITVKELATHTFIAETSCSKQLGTLKANGYVQSTKKGKASYYEMTEPLMRLCLEVKNQRGKPLKLVTQFIKAWFTTEKLESSTGSKQLSERTSAYLQAALKAESIYSTPIKAALEAEIALCTENRQESKIAELTQQLSYITTKEKQLEKSEKAKEPSLKALKLLERAAKKFENREYASVINDYTQLIEIKGVPSDLLAQALFNRGLTKNKIDDLLGEIADYDQLIEMKNKPKYLHANALLSRGITKGRLNETKSEISDYTQLIEMQDAPSNLRAEALLYRGITKGMLNDLDGAIADSTQIIEMTDLPSQLLAKALLIRSIAKYKLDDFEGTIADYTLIIEKVDVSSDLRAGALLNRGVSKSSINDHKGAIADYTQLIEMKDAPNDQRAKALMNLGTNAFHEQDYGKTHEYLCQAASIDDITDNDLTGALFSIPEPLINLSTPDAVLEALKHAFKEGWRNTDEYGGTPNDLLMMVLRYGQLQWNDYIIGIILLYSEYNELSRLGQGLVQSLTELESDYLTSSQLDDWVAIWSEFGAGHEELELPIASLRAAVEAIKTQDDKPLFQLPKEIRAIVRGQLSLGEN